MNIFLNRMAKTWKFILAVFCVSLIFLSSLVPVMAQPNLKDAFSSDTAKPLGSFADKAGYDTQNSSNPMKIVGMVIQAALGLLGVVFLILMVYGGYLWMTSHGDEQKATKAKETINAAIIGLVIVIGAYAISYYVVAKLGKGALKATGSAI